MLGRCFPALVILLFKSSSRLLSRGPLRDGKRSYPPKGPSVDETRLRCHNTLASNFTRFRCPLCLLSERDWGSCRSRQSSAFASFVDSAPASSISLLAHGFTCSQLNGLDELLLKVWCDAFDCCWINLQIEILISADLGRIMISKQTIDRTTVPSSEDTYDSQRLPRFGTFLAESFLYILDQSLEEDKTSLSLPEVACGWLGELAHQGH